MDRPRFSPLPWDENVIYELHCGAFTAAGDFPAAADRLTHLRGLGVTAVELMPLADSPGRRNWGYDGALPLRAEPELRPAGAASCLREPGA
ncbi:MAG: hypothetical protein QM757_08780 [Paludibaculum sp.]